MDSKFVIVVVLSLLFVSFATASVEDDIAAIAALRQQIEAEAQAATIARVQAETALLQAEQARDSAAQSALEAIASRRSARKLSRDNRQASSNEQTHHRPDTWYQDVSPAALTPEEEVKRNECRAAQETCHQKEAYCFENLKCVRNPSQEPTPQCKRCFESAKECMFGVMDDAECSRLLPHPPHHG